jgi:beta-carotene/zeaxanthin 4-ketolase
MDFLLTELWMPLLLLTGWGSSVWLAGAIDLAACPPSTFLILLAVRTFLQTGLFITAHDAMHGTIVPGQPVVNRAIGQLCVILYALLPYNLLYVNHQLHHRYPATERDPDFCTSAGCSGWHWYLRFISSYLKQVWPTWLLGMVTLWTGLVWTGWSIPKILLLWLLPLWLSSLQLFYFGTFQPHRWREPRPSLEVRSSSLPLIWSLLTCYHFGYHLEHHEYPHLPWYKLPTMKKM